MSLESLWLFVQQTLISDKTSLISWLSWLDWAGKRGEAGTIKTCRSQQKWKLVEVMYLINLLHCTSYFRYSTVIVIVMYPADILKWILLERCPHCRVRTCCGSHQETILLFDRSLQSIHFLAANLPDPRKLSLGRSRRPCWDSRIAKGRASQISNLPGVSCLMQSWRALQATTALLYITSSKAEFWLF